MRMLNPQCINQEMSYRYQRMRRGLAPLTGIFEGSTDLDVATRRRRTRQASTRVGSPTREAQSLIQVTRRQCPWQLFQDPETGQTQIERRYDPEDEPLTKHVFDDSYDEADVA
jgi:hypothetical protein